ncbi:MAG: xanthine dehydrogenase molybdopterin binding subunit [Myxococcota bacterium]|nr:xanthine dehydrogenase molybdopterin binding subunit [Myxococcota bacterium]MEC8382024.1 xanthine dehydrogenase molybdopterin binding subunit [Myxococcota bacterium]
MNQRSKLHQNQHHESATRHVTGAARYVDDLPHPPGLLHALIVPSTVAHAQITELNTQLAKSVPGIHAVLVAADIPGDTHVGPIIHDEPLLATDLVHFYGQAIALVVGETRDACRQAAQLIEIKYSTLPAITKLEDAIKSQSYHGEPHTIARGNLESAFGEAPHQLTGTVQTGGQDHFYLETQVSLCVPEEAQCFKIYSSTQHPTEIQKMAAHILGVGSNQVTCEVPRLGGGFGGKESQATQFGALAALGSYYTKRPVKLWLNRDSDMCWTGKRHPFYSSYRVGYNSQGQILGLEIDIYSDGGWTLDLSHPVLDRALFHLDNAYFIPTLRFTGRVCKTNTPSNTAFRGFGGPQGVVVIERILNRIAHSLSLDPAEIRRRNYYGPSPRNKAPYGQEVVFEDNRLARIHQELLNTSNYEVRRLDISNFNLNSTYIKKGIAFQPVKFGISFTKSLLNQAGAFINVYTDGRVQLNHSGTEMGQGLFTKMITICAHNLGVPVSWVRNMHTSTEKVPNTSPTAASSGSDLNGAAVKIACDTLLSRLRPLAQRMLNSADSESIIFAQGQVWHPSMPAKQISFPELCNQAWVEQISLSATGYYRTPGIAYDHSVGQGTPFFYFAYGAAITEVSVNTLTGEYRITRVDILHDVGESLIPAIDKGQVEGAFAQGIGWLSTEELRTHNDGRLLTHSPSTYKIPAFGDLPKDFRVNLLKNAPQNNVIHGSKAVGEPPFVLAISLVTALQHALSTPDRLVPIQMPCTSEQVLKVIYRNTLE